MRTQEKLESRAASLVQSAERLQRIGMIYGDEFPTLERELNSIGMDLEHHAASLRELLPEERAGRCWCGLSKATASGQWTLANGDDVLGRVYPSETRDRYCLGCGAHLGEDGIARRNAAVAQVERVREALDEVSTCDSGSAVYAVDVIRAALDGPQEVRDEQDA